MSTWRFATEQYEEDEGGWFGLVTFIAACIGVGAGLWWFTGPPTMFTSAPDWTYIREVLGSSEVRDRDVITVTAGVAWIIIGYVLLTVALRLLFGAALALTGGAGWARAALQATSPLTIPVVRRMVDAALAGTIMVSATLHTPSAGFASSAAVAAVVQTRVPAQIAALDSTKVTSSAPSPALVAETVPKTHTVVGGDNLWRIAERYLDDGFRWTEIWRLNRHQAMDDGRRFVDPNLIYPGWVLQLPEDADVGLSDDGGLDTNPAPPDPEVIPEGNPSPTPSTPDPTPTQATPTPSAAAGGPAVSPTAPATRDDGGEPAFRPSLPEIPTPGGAATVASVAGAAAGSVAMLLVLRRFLRHRRAAAASGGRRPLGSGDAGRVLAIASALRSALVDLDFADSRVLLVRESEHYLEFTLDCPPGDGEALAGSANQLSRRLGCLIDGAVASPTTITLKASRISRLASSLFPESGPFPDLLLPVGATESGIYYLNLAAVGTVLVAGGRLGTRELVAGWITTLTSVETDARLSFTMDASARDHLDRAAAASLAVGELAATDGLALAEWSRQLERELIGRQQDPPPARVIAIAGPVADAEVLPGELDGLMRLGPERGLHLVAIADGLQVSRVSRSFGACVILGEEGDADGSGLVTLEVAGQLALELEQVVVRRQVASRPPPVEQDADAFADFEPSPHDSDWQVIGHDATPELEADAGATAPRPEPVPDTADRFGDADDADVDDVAAAAAADEFDGIEDFEPDSGPEPEVELEPHAPPPPNDVTSTEGQASPGTNVEPAAAAAIDGSTELLDHAEAGHPPRRASTAAPVQEHSTQLFDGESVNVEPSTPSTNGVHEGTTGALAPEPRDASPPGTMDRQSALPIGDIEVDGSSSGPPLRARLFGAFELETRDGPIYEWSIQKSRELAAYLLAHGGAPVLRETVAGALWPRMPITAAKHQGANAAYYLRRTLSRVLGKEGGQVITGANQRYGVRPGTIRTDVDAFDAHLHRAERLEGYEALIEYERGLSLYRDDFLAPEMFEWADTYQRSYRARFIAAAHRAARLAVDCRDTQLAVRYYESILRFDPIDEDAVRGLLRCYALLGDTNSARMAYKHLVMALRETLDDDHAEPMPATTKVFNEFHANGHRTGEAPLDDTRR